MIELLPGFPDAVVAAACRGHVTREDYDSVLIPRVAEALKKHDAVRVYYQIGDDFNGIDPGAVWEDIVVGVSHLPHWDRIAVVTDIGWIRTTMNMFGFLVPGKVRVFPASEVDAARKWIVSV